MTHQQMEVHQWSVHVQRNKQVTEGRTPMTSLSAVSDPMLNSVPGTLLLIVAGIRTIGMQNSGYLLRVSASTSAL